MGKCYCDYCDVFLTNDSVAVRKQHNEGNRHKYNVCEYYRQYIGEQLQKQIDDIVASFELRVAQALITPTYALPAAQKNASTHGQLHNGANEAMTDEHGAKGSATKRDESENIASKEAAGIDASRGPNGTESAAEVARTNRDRPIADTSPQTTETESAIEI